MSKVTHILFDFFGTLVEYSDSWTEQGYQRSHEVLLSNGADIDYQVFLDRWSDVFREFESRSERNHDEYSMNEVVAAFLSEVLGSTAASDLVHVFRDIYLQEWNQGVRYIDGVAPLLNQLANRYTLVLVTNTHSAELVRAHVREMQVEDCFSAIVTSVEHGKRKPCASIFRCALNATGSQSETAVYVGDSFAADYVGAKAVGMRCLLIDPDARQDVPAEDRISHVLDLRHALEAG